MARRYGGRGGRWKLNDVDMQRLCAALNLQFDLKYLPREEDVLMSAEFLREDITTLRAKLERYEAALVRIRDKANYCEKSVDATYKMIQVLSEIAAAANIVPFSREKEIMASIACRVREGRPTQAEVEQFNGPGTTGER